MVYNVRHPIKLTMAYKRNVPDKLIQSSTMKYDLFAIKENM